MAMTYAQSGVDIDAGNRAVGRIGPLVRRTFDSSPVTILQDVGGFSGLTMLPGGMVLGASTDGVGTKLKLAILMDDHKTVGIDLVAMCVNDLIVAGLTPIFFVDYIAQQQQVIDRTEALVSGMVDGCLQSHMALIGGEMAELPLLYAKGDYDLAGFAVGMASSEGHLMLGNSIAPDMNVYGLSSDGVHSNGFSLIWKVYGIDFDDTYTARHKLDKRYSQYGVRSLGEELLTPTKIYVSQVEQLAYDHTIAGMVHITGGGLVENPPRILPEGCSMLLDTNSWEVPAIFQDIMRVGDVEIDEMRKTYNMGLGMLVVSPDDIPELNRVGRVIEGNQEVVFV